MKRQLSILQVSTADIGGGAERIAWNLHHIYRARGHCAWLAVGRKRSDDPDVLLIPNQDQCRGWSRFWWGLHSRLQSLDGRMRGARPLSRLAHVLADPGAMVDGYRGVEDFRFPGTWQLLKLTTQPPDVVHCHNLHGDYFDLRAISMLSHQVPMILTLHDEWLLTGHCACTLGCERWKTGCGACPDLTIYPAVRRDATQYNRQRKQSIYAKSRLYVATPSWWLMQRVQQSTLVPGMVDARVVPNGVDLSVFHSADKQAARAALGIPHETKVLLFAAYGIRQNIFKDYKTMRAAVGLVAHHLHGQTVLFIGLGENAPSEQIGKAEIRFVPYQKDLGTVARFYQAADVYLHAARADTFPNTVLEALACGTPVVASSVGGIPEQIEDGVTGFLVPPGDASAMAACIEQLLSDGILRQRFAAAAAEATRRRFDLNRQVNSYLAWYEEIIANNRSWAASAAESRSKHG